MYWGNFPGLESPSSSCIDEMRHTAIKSHTVKLNMKKNGCCDLYGLFTWIFECMMEIVVIGLPPSNLSSQCRTPDNTNLPKCIWKTKAKYKESVKEEL